MKEDHNINHHSLRQPLIPLFTPSSSSSSYSLHNNNNIHHHIHDNNNDNDNSIILRILLFLSVSLISLWANYEASKTFHITILNDTKDSPAGRRFDLSYVSNDKATRILLNTSSFAQHLLYNNNNDNTSYKSKKRIGSVTLRLAPHNLNTTTATATVRKDLDNYVIDLSPVLLEDGSFDNKVAIVGAIQRAMARVWLFDGGSRAPLGLLDGMAEYVAQLAGFRRRETVSSSVFGGGGCDGGGAGGLWWEDRDPGHVARWLHYCENYREGFIRRLNQAMRDTWHDRMVDDVLGIPATKLCGLYNASWLNLIWSE